MTTPHGSLDPGYITATQMKAIATIPVPRIPILRIEIGGRLFPPITNKIPAPSTIVHGMEPIRSDATTVLNPKWSSKTKAIFESMLVAPENMKLKIRMNTTDCW
eukprot:CAMPEP_0119527392 /NCGR_PEP_ID=MMETSP1344-20130328/41805_1 /TAXON_ID=236787 /ORGANISM="Florenciella parvula, Strain CCMP2471" /LENGTH=103 /DNA_ID=CAMNT_0007566577 /DNA_START=132 /DNA_END=443 /DNA_ORIENTATION=-